MDLLRCFNTDRAPLLFSQTPLFSLSQEYHQPTLLPKSYPYTARAIKTTRCLNTLQMIAPAPPIKQIFLMRGITILLPMIGLNSWPGYHPWILVYGIVTFRNVVSAMSGNGSHKQRNSEDGTDWVGEVKVKGPFSFAMGILGSERHLSGNKAYSPRREESEPVLMRRDDSSLVVDTLCDQASGQNAAVSCFYLDFAARKEQSATNVLGSLLKHIVSGMERIPEEISRAFQQQKTTIGGRRAQLVDIVKMLRFVTSSRPTFMCLDALDECGRVQRARILDSLNQIVEKSPCTRIFTTGRPHIRAEMEKRLAGHVTSVSVSPNGGDITRFLRARLGEDEMLDAMDESLEVDILEKIPENMSEM